MTYANGQLVASQDEAGKLDATGQLTGFSNTSMGRTQVQVQQGDTLKSLAQRVYGNENLWYVLADANGLQGDDALVAGSSLTVPEVKTSSNDASTFKPYNPSEITGPTTPSLPYIAPPSASCDPISTIIMAVVTVLVVAYAPALAAKLPAFGAMIGGTGAFAGVTVGAAATASGIVAVGASAAARGVASAMGMASFSWRAVAVDGITSALSAGLGELLKGAGSASASGATYKTVTEAGKTFRQLTPLGRVLQGVGNHAGGMVAQVATGQDTNFSWNGVAAAAVGSYVSAKLGGRVPLLGGGDPSTNPIGGFAESFLDGAASSSARRLFGLGRQNWGQIALDAFGNTVASGVGQSIVASGRRQADSGSRDSVDGGAGNPFGLSALLADYTNTSFQSGETGGSGAGYFSLAMSLDRAASRSAAGLGSGRGGATSLPSLGDYAAVGYATDGTPVLEPIEVTATPEQAADARRYRQISVNPIVAKYHASQGAGVLKPEVFAQRFEARARDMGYDPAELARVQVVRQAAPRYYATNAEVSDRLRSESYWYGAGLIQAFAPALVPMLSTTLPAAGAAALGYGRAGGQLALQFGKAVVSSPWNTLQGLAGARSWSGAYAALYANMPGNVASAGLVAETVAEGYVATRVVANRAVTSEVAALRRISSANTSDAGRVFNARISLKPHVVEGDVTGLIGRLDVSSSGRSLGFWSGNLDAAMSQAARANVALLETTPGGRIVNDWGFLNKRWNWKAGGEQFWGGLSSKYASGARGDVFVWQAPDRAIDVGGTLDWKGGYVWQNYERPTIMQLQSIGTVRNINYGLVEPTLVNAPLRWH